MNKKTKEIIESSEFFDFVNREFEKTAGIATIEELADFAFGSLDEAVKVYLQEKEK